MIETAKGAALTMKRQEKKRQDKANKLAEEAKKAQAVANPEPEYTAEEWAKWIEARGVCQFRALAGGDGAVRTAESHAKWGFGYL